MELSKVKKFEDTRMCRNIKPLFNYDPPASDDEIRDAAIQFVRKISGYRKPSKVNEVAFQAAVDAITTASTELIHSLETNAPLKNRAKEIAKVKTRSAKHTGGESRLS